MNTRTPVSARTVGSAFGTQGDFKVIRGAGAMVGKTHFAGQMGEGGLTLDGCDDSYRAYFEAGRGWGKSGRPPIPLAGRGWKWRR